MAQLNGTVVANKNLSGKIIADKVINGIVSIGSGGSSGGNDVKEIKRVDTPSFEFTNGRFYRNDSKYSVWHMGKNVQLTDTEFVFTPTETKVNYEENAIFMGRYTDTDFTVEVYFKTTDLDFNVGTTYSQYAMDNFESGGFALGISNENNEYKLMCGYRSGTSYKYIRGEVAVENKYNYLIMTVDSTNKKVICFINGVRYEDTITTYGVPTNTTNIALGGNAYSNTYIDQDFLHGTVRVARYYDRVLTEEECLLNYNYILEANL